MSGLSPTEEKFEEHIERHLCSIGYTSTHFHDYDRSLCLIKDQVIEFIKNTQPEKWDQLTQIYDVDTENKVLSRISSEISKRGVIDVLRNNVVDRGIYLDLCYFEPKSDLNQNTSNCSNPIGSQWLDNSTTRTRTRIRLIWVCSSMDYP